MELALESRTSAGGERWISLIHIYFQFEIRWEFIKERQVLVDWPWSQIRAGEQPWFDKAMTQIANQLFAVVHR